jgi:ABC-type sugar transport system ATPase subunit
MEKEEVLRAGRVDGAFTATVTRRPVLAVTDAHKRFGRVRALNGATIEIFSGEVHGLVGANGAGKSTLVKVVSGAERLDSGVLVVGDFEAGTITPREAQTNGLATIYQDTSLVPTLGLAQNIVLGREASRAHIFLDSRSERAEVKRSLKRVGLRDRQHLTAGQLSPSEQQLLEIAKALYRRARIVVMDEPTASLGNAERDRLFSVIDALREDGTGVLYISHKLREVLEVCERVTVMRDGETVATADTEGLSEDRLVRLMIGHSLKSVAGHRDQVSSGVAMRVRGLGQGIRLSDIDLDLHDGEVLGVTGLVGSGRSRLARVLFGAERYDAGSIELYGQDYRPSDPHDAIDRGLGLVPQDRKRDALQMSMSVEDNITLPRMPTSLPGFVRRRTERADAMRWIRHLNIKTPSPAAPPSSLSGGNQQKVAVARWLHAEARVLIFDEPGQAVDVGAKEEIFAAIRALAAEGKAVMVISEEIEELQQLADRLIVMRGGRISGELRLQDITEENVIALSMGVNIKGDEVIGHEY